MFFRYFGWFQHALHFTDGNHRHKAEEEEYTYGKYSDGSKVDADFNPGW